MKKMHLIVASLLLAVGACGGDGDGSGLDSSKQLGALSESEVSSLCSSVLAAQGGAGTVTECDGFTVTVDTQAECEEGFGALDGCTATVGNAETCADALGEDPCADVELPAACASVFACFEA